MADRRERGVRQLLDGPHPYVPPGLVEEATVRGGRLLRRRRLTRRLALAAALLAVALFTVWAVHNRPWQHEPAAPAPPPGIGW
ncbi:hypothetical protein MTQ01_06550 [Streptomyces sp. XM4193]|uniref:hypothetical protein n=1 Tax=Streptomyces sp. XM4193 TaxID=2929782 RepID=UPI001FF8F161|nr:hypothetical protein [Streptomyces sp. XM4193]MCK1795673.1 hypothetical protein [Streptomyces sp. XM4193]